MFYLLITLIFLFPIWIGFGKIGDKSTNRLSWYLLKGICIISCSWTIISLFFPLSIYVEFFTIIIGYGLFFYLKGYDAIYEFFSKINTLPFLLLIIFIAGIGSSFPYIVDHFGYYLPSITILSSEGLVKGVANLDLILGQMSVWHIFQAGFSHFSDPFLRINALLLIVYVIYLFENRIKFQLVYVPILIAFTQSPSTDLPAIVIGLMVLNEIMKGSTNLVSLFAISCFVFIIKPTAIWVPLFCLLYGIFIVKNEKQDKLKFLSVGVLVFLLFIVKNCWTFGYPIFPIAAFDFDFSWKANPELLIHSTQLAMEKTYDLQYTYNQIQQFTWYEKIINWFSLSGIKGIIHYLFVLTLLLLMIVTWKKKNPILRLLLIAILIKSVLVVLFSAQYRFFLDVFFVTGIVLFQPIIKEKWIIKIVSLLGIVSTLLFLFPTLIQKIIPTFRLGYMMKKPNSEIIYQPLTYQYTNYDSYQVGNLKFNVIKNYPFTFDTPPPAISPSYLYEYHNLGIFPQKIDQHYIWVEMDSIQKQQLSSIIEKIKRE